MKHKRLWSRILVLALIMMIAVQATTLKTYAEEKTEIQYIWSKDWSQVTASEYEIEFDDSTPERVLSYTLLHTETVDTVISPGEDGKLIYTAHFTNSEFSEQTRTCLNSDDVVISWNFDSDPVPDGWESSASYDWWREDEGVLYFSNWYFYHIYGKPIDSPIITLPENAKLTFWLSGGAETNSDTGNVIIRCNGDIVANSYITGELRNKPVIGDIIRYTADNYWQYYVDLSEYAGKEVRLSFDFEPEGSFFYARIDNIEIHGDAIITTGWQQDSDDKWMYFDENGTPVTGWKKIDEKWYYFDKSGIMQTGWKKSGGKWYYLDPKSGWMVTGWKQISGKWYYFKTSGIMAANEYCKGYWLNSDGTWTYKPKAS